MSYKSYLYIFQFLIFISCNRGGGQQEKMPEEFNAYWYSGKAEIVSYELKQARYGEIHDGSAVLIFVTEDFSNSKQVKLDNPEEAGDDRVKVIKLNLTKKFNTGIYPYSIMMSVFSPVDITLKPLKFTMSAQEWCGQVFTQMNLDGTRYEVEQYSYFESDGDKDYAFMATFSEDEIWNRIRLDYESLPVGEMEIIPGMITTRLLHQEFSPVTARAELNHSGDTITYSVLYENGHSLKIRFAKDFPHLIYGWEEEFKGIDNNRIITTARFRDSLFVDYWTKNKREFLHLRDSLGLR